MPSRQINELSQKGNRKKLSYWPDLAILRVPGLAGDPAALPGGLPGPHHLQDFVRIRPRVQDHSGAGHPDHSEEEGRQREEENGH